MTPGDDHTGRQLDRFDVGGLLAQARRLADLSQRELAARSGLSQSAIAGYESGARVPRADVLARLLAAAGLRLAVLDTSAQEVRPFSPDAVRDNAGRRFPAHLDAAHPDVVDQYVRRPRHDRPERLAGFERRKDRDIRRARDGVVPARHITPGEVELPRLDRRYRRDPSYWARRRPALVRRLGVDRLDPWDGPDGRGAD